MSDESVSRRSALKTLDALGVAPLVGHADRSDVPAREAGRSDRRAPEPGRRTVAEHPRLRRLRAGRMLVAGRLTLRMTASTGLVATARLTIQGLDAGTYELTYGRASRTRDVSRALELEVPMGQAEAVEIRRRGT